MPPVNMPHRRIKVLIVDDSAVARKILSELVAAEPDMEVVGTAADAFLARDKILAFNPDVVTLDIEMPHMDGLTFLKWLMQEHPIPTLIVSSRGQASYTATLEALRCGAVDVLDKPTSQYSVGDLRQTLAAKIRGAACARPRAGGDLNSAQHPQPAAVVNAVCDPRAIIAIGASTGGTVAIQKILTQLSADMPPIVVTQHLPAGFSQAFASRLNQLCSMEVREAVSGDRLRRGLALIAPGDHHLLVRRVGGGYSIELQQGPQVCYQRPSVDTMFASVAQAAGSHGIGVLLTGMGTDGAEGMLALKHAGAATIAQDEASCVVYGMPRQAKRLDAVGVVASLADIPAVLARTAGASAHGASGTLCSIAQHKMPPAHANRNTGGERGRNSGGGRFAQDEKDQSARPQEGGRGL